jgi:Fe-S-cluster containining protein
MTTETVPLAAVADVYRHIDETVGSWMFAADRVALDARTKSLCHACGKCCDFDSYDHKLYVTSLEIAYLASIVGKENVLPMTGGTCPFQLRGECTIHPYRFAGCRIFYCKGDAQAQAELSEWVAARFKAISDESGQDYSYTDLKTALNTALRF